MAIMKAIKKCIECYKDDKCALTITMKELYKGPYRDKQEHIQALRENIINNRNKN